MTNNNNNNGGSEENGGLTQCVAIYDYIGNLQHNKLQFCIYDLLDDVDYRIPSQNRYRLGQIQHQEDWFPNWVIQPVTKGTPPPTTMARPPHLCSQQQRPIHFPPQQKMMHHNGCIISPMRMHHD